MNTKTIHNRTFILNAREVKALQEKLGDALAKPKAREVIRDHDSLCPQQIPQDTPVKYPSTSWRLGPLFKFTPPPAALTELKSKLSSIAIGRSQHVCLRIEENNTDQKPTIHLWNPFTGK